MPNEPIAHLVWLQGRLAPDDVEDYYEVARPGDTSVDGSDPFPVYRASPSDAERHERSPKSNMLEIAVTAVLEADKEFRSNMPDEWDGDPLSGELDGLRRIFEAHLSAPPPPAAVQEPVAVKAVEIEELIEELLDAQQDINLAANTTMDQSLCNASALIDKTETFLRRIRSALSTSQSDPAPEISVSGDTIERVAKALALDMYPDTRWPDSEADANSGIDDRQGRHPVSWHFASKCRSQALAAIIAIPTPALREDSAPEMVVSGKPSRFLFDRIDPVSGAVVEEVSKIDRTGEPYIQNVRSLYEIAEQMADAAQITNPFRDLVVRAQAIISESTYPKWHADAQSSLCGEGK